MNKTGNAKSSNWKRIFTEKVLPSLIITGGTMIFDACKNYIKHKRKLKEISHATNEKIRQQATKKKNINSSENIPIVDSSESSMISVTADNPVSTDYIEKTQKSSFGNVIFPFSGYGIIVGPQNEGKSTLLMQIAMSFASGRPTGLMGNIQESGLKPHNVIMYCTEKDSQEMRQMGHINYPEISKEDKRRIEYICNDNSAVTINNILKHLRKKVNEAQENILAIYDCISSEYSIIESTRTQAKIRTECEDFIRIANEKGIIFQFIIVCHVLGGTYKIGRTIDTNSIGLGDKLINGSRFIIGLAPIGEEHSQFKYLKVIRCKTHPEPDDVAIIRWSSNHKQRFQHVARMKETDILSNPQCLFSSSSPTPKKRGTKPKVSDEDIIEAIKLCNNQKEAAELLGISPSALSQRLKHVQST